MESTPTSPDGDHQLSPSLPANSSHQDESGDHNTVQIFYTQELSGIASKLGAEQTRSKLLPCLLTQCQGKEDEIKASFAEEMGHFGPLVGGLDHVHCLFPILEVLTTEDAGNVRDNVLAAIMRLSEGYTVQDFETKLFPVLKRMSSSKVISSRAAACGLIGFSYSRVGPVTRDKLRSLFRKSSWDSPTVREKAADALDQLARIIEERHLKNFLIIFKRLAYDLDANVRARTVKAAISLASRMSKEHIQTNIFPSITVFANDTSGCVRIEVARIMLKLQGVMDKDFTILHLVPIFKAMLSDPETSVREVSSKQINTFCRKVDKRYQKEVILQTVLPAVLKLVDDSSAKVRSELASVVMDLCPMFCERDVNQFLWQIFLILTEDNSNEVRVSIISNLGGLKKFLTVSQFDAHVVPIVKYLASSTTWRSRMETIRCISRLAIKLGKKFFASPIVEICVGLLVDPVYTVREEMAIVLGKITAMFGTTWAKDKLLDKVFDIANRARYLHRLSFLSCMSYLAKPCGSELTTSTILPAILALSQDPVPNVRFNVAKTLHRIAHVLDQSSLTKQVLPVLVTLQSDPDVDVIYFAEEAFNVITKMCETSIVNIT